jgi:pectin methylesterase-like acyl-CoA thioesterase
MKSNVLNQIKQLLGMEVKLEQMKLADGMTVIEADSFESEMSVVIVTEDEQKIPLPVGEYELEDGRILVVAVEGIISEIKEKEEEAPEVEIEVEAPEAEVPVEAEAEIATPKKTVESIIKETFFSEMEALKAENEELKAKLETFSKVDPVAEVATEEATDKVELEEVKPITFNPEKTNPTEFTKLASKRPRTTMDSIIEKLNK